MGLAGASALGTLFPPGVVVEVATDDDSTAPLFDEEARYVASAIPARVREYRRGRAAARRALVRLGQAATAIPARPDRTPQWPTGVAGTIAHTQGRCAAAVAAANRYLSIGLDIERTHPLPPDVRAAVCTAAELDWMGAYSNDVPWDLLTFVAKEAFYKAWFPRTGTFIDFHDVAVRFDPETTAFTFCGIGGLCSTDALANYRGRWARDDEFLCAGVWVPNVLKSPASTYHAAQPQDDRA